MSYELLSKIFYKKPDEYERIYEARFNSEATVRLPLEINGNHAFYINSSEITFIVGEIYKQCMVITSKSDQNLPEIAKHSFIKGTLIEEIQVTNEIEGVSSTRKEIKHAVDEEENKKTKNLYVRFSGLVEKYNRIVIDDNISLQTCTDIRTLYDEFVLKEIEKDDYPDGEIFRKEAVEVRAATQRVKHTGVLPEARIQEEITEILNFLNDNNGINPLIKIAVFHYFFGYIHPFYDGNGRLSRFISSYLLSKELELFAGLRLSYTIKDQIKAYYKVFDTCNDTKNKGDITPFIITFLTFILDSYNNLEKILDDSNEKLEFYNDIILGLNYSDDQQDTLSVLVQNSLYNDYVGLDIAELSEIMDVSSTKMREIMKMLVSEELVLQKKNGRKYNYIVNLEKLDNMRRV